MAYTENLGNPEMMDALAYIGSTDWRKSRLGLERVEELLRRLGSPQDTLRFIHVAGTNGKGSVAAMLAGVLQAAGHRTGLYTSPFIRFFNERIQVNGAPIPDEALVRVTEAVRREADAMEDHPTEFELVTAMGMVYFAQTHCDVVVLEVGLGGRLDATNVIGVPELAVITAIGLDHTRELGHTLPQIAAEKAGIIKPGGDVVVYPQPGEVEDVFVAAAQARSARLRVADFAALRMKDASLEGQVFDFGGYEDLRIGLLGAYQPRNAALVVTAAEALRQKGWNIPEAALRDGLRLTRWPARFELVGRQPNVIVDGGHNPQGTRALIESMERYFPGQKAIFVMGVMADKDYAHMVRELLPLAKRVVCVAPPNERALAPELLAAEFAWQGFAAAEAADSVAEGARMALGYAEKDDVICAFGSFYMAGELRQVFGTG